MAHGKIVSEMVKELKKKMIVFTKDFGKII